MRLWNTSAPARSASWKLGRPSGTIMNSWKSSALLAWAPPLMMFIRGTGSTRALGPPRYLYSGISQLERRRPGRRHGHAQDGVGARLGLVGGAVGRQHRRVQPGLIEGVAADHRRGQDLADVVHRLVHALAQVALASPSRSSSASCSPVEAPEGTAPVAIAPDSSSTSASTVGLPRESRISRAETRLMMALAVLSWRRAHWHDRASRRKAPNWQRRNRGLKAPA